MAVLKRESPEDRLISAVIRHFGKNNSLRIYREVAFLSKRIDIVLVDERTDEISAIETKVSWWEKVIHQAKLDLLGADKVYVALPDNKTRTLPNYQTRLKNYGIGFLGIHLCGRKSSVREIIQPSHSRYKSSSREQELKNSIEKGFYLRCIKCTI